MQEKLIKYLKSLLVIIITCTVVYSGFKIFCFDKFIVKGDSMLPTYGTGDVIWVNKLLMGPRIYKSYDFESVKLESFRLPGFRSPQIGDVVVFNTPFGRGNRKIEFLINHVFAKRILGCPGDTIGVKNAHYYNFEDCKPFGDLYSQDLLSIIKIDDLGYDPMVFPRAPSLEWTVHDMGPLLVPSKGIEIELTKNNVNIYGIVIEYEMGSKPDWVGTDCIIGGEIYHSYTFKKDYYYLVGDNVLNSLDSRYFGFVPKDYIIGIVIN